MRALAPESGNERTASAAKQFQPVRHDANQWLRLKTSQAKRSLHLGRTLHPRKLPTAYALLAAALYLVDNGIGFVYPDR